MLTRHVPPSLWTLRATGGSAPAEIAARHFDAPVPGDVHTALRRAGAIPDPLDGSNEAELAWIGTTDWEYATTLTALDPHAAASERIDVVFHGVDTIATAVLDGQVSATSRNMHRTWRIPAPQLAQRQAELRIQLAAPVTAAQAERDRLGERPSAFHPLPPFIRKKACDFGWDWGPSLPGAGIWRDVIIEAWSTARLAAVRPTATVESGDGATTGRVDLDIDLERTATGEHVDLEIVVSMAGHTAVLAAPAGTRRIRGFLEVPDPALWWPAGLGAPALHTLEVTLTGAGTTLDTVSQRIGFRDLVIDQVDDEAGRSFGVTVNGVPLFVRGFNWIPDDTSIAEVTDADYRRRIADAADLGANLIRVWGGGVFESDAFYRACDEAGMLVWQDFLFACAAYPEEAPFADEVEAEARDNVTRLMAHPSLALWNGNNENLWFWFLHHWDELLGGASWGEAFYVDILPRVLADLDPQRTYLIGSPSSGGRWDAPNDPARGVVHWWIPDDYLAYDEVRPRFVSEFGFQGPPARPTFDAVVHDDAPAPFSPGTVQRQKAEGGTERINTVLDAHFGVPRDFDEWYWLAQLNQARAVRYGVERFRVLEPYCRGTIVWQLNDCWPAMSWSMIDVDDHWKPAAYAVREAYRDRIVVLRLEDGHPALFACNSTGEPWDACIDVQRWTSAQRLDTAQVAWQVPAHTAVRVTLPPWASVLAAEQLLVATAPVPGAPRPTRSCLLGATDRDFPDAAPSYRVTIEPQESAVLVRLTDTTLLRDAVLATEEVDEQARCDVNVVTVLPGEDAQWRIETSRPELFTESAVRSVLRTARAASQTDPGFRSLAMLEAEKAAAREPVG